MSVSVYHEVKMILFELSVMNFYEDKQSNVYKVDDYFQPMTHHITQG